MSSNSSSSRRNILTAVAVVVIGPPEALAKALSLATESRTKSYYGS